MTSQTSTPQNRQEYFFKEFLLAMADGLLPAERDERNLTAKLLEIHNEIITEQPHLATDNSSVAIAHHYFLVLRQAITQTPEDEHTFILKHSRNIIKFIKLTEERYQRSLVTQGAPQ